MNLSQTKEHDANLEPYGGLRDVADRHVTVAASAHRDHQPWRRHQGIDEKADSRRDRPKLVQFALRQIAAGSKEQVSARPLWRDDREVVRREEQLERENRRAHAELNADVEEHAEQREQMRGL